jgi:putative DeoR family transcriptional regulator (stage III sporulation protein D)
MSERLPRVNPNLWAGVKKVLDKNKAERHIRGGRATRIKYQMENEGTSHEKNAK